MLYRACMRPCRCKFMLSCVGTKNASCFVIQSRMKLLLEYIKHVFAYLVCFCQRSEMERAIIFLQVSRAVGILIHLCLYFNYVFLFCLHLCLYFSCVFLNNVPLRTLIQNETDLELAELLRMNFQVVHQELLLYLSTHYSQVSGFQSV